MRMPAPPQLRIKPTREINNLAIPYIQQRILRTPMPRVHIRAHIQHHLCIGIRIDEFHGKHARRDVSDSNAMADESVEFCGGYGGCSGFVAVPFSFGEARPGLKAEAFFKGHVEAVEGVVVAEGEEGLLEGFGAGAWHAYAYYLHWVSAFAWWGVGDCVGFFEDAPWPATLTWGAEHFDELGVVLMRLGMVMILTNFVRGYGVEGLRVNESTS